MANYPISRYKVLIHTTSLIAASISFISCGVIPEERI